MAEKAFRLNIFLDQPTKYGPLWSFKDGGKCQFFATFPSESAWSASPVPALVSGGESQVAALSEQTPGGGDCAEEDCSG